MGCSGMRQGPHAASGWTGNGGRHKQAEVVVVSVAASGAVRAGGTYRPVTPPGGAPVTGGAEARPAPLNDTPRLPQEDSSEAAPISTATSRQRQRSAMVTMGMDMDMDRGDGGEGGWLPVASTVA